VVAVGRAASEWRCPNRAQHGARGGHIEIAGLPQKAARPGGRGSWKGEHAHAEAALEARLAGGENICAIREPRGYAAEFRFGERMRRPQYREHAASVASRD
jgi:hypothetical protein